MYNWYKTASNVAFIRGENAESLTKATGEAGFGYYFSPVRNREMVDYYTSDSKHVWMAYPKSECKIADLTQPLHLKGIIDLAVRNREQLKKEMPGYIDRGVNRANYQRNPYTIEEYIRKNLPNIDAYLIAHRGSGIPTGKQLVIVNLDAFDLEQIK